MRAIRWTLFALVALIGLLAWRPAHAQSADDRPCEVCLTKADAAALKKKALRGEKYDDQKAAADAAEKERNEVVAEKNVVIGQLKECRVRDDRHARDRDRWRDQAIELKADQVNPLRWLSFGACGALGAGAGALFAAGEDVSGYVAAAAAVVSCAAGIIFD